MDYTFDSKARMDAALNMRAGSDMPVLAFVALQDHTTLRVWPGSWRAIHAAWTGKPIPSLPNGGRMKTARFEEGDLLLFRPDFVHAGERRSCEDVE